jgi:altronate dehydratase large subunit
MEFLGYERPDGTFGVRNYPAIFGIGTTGQQMAVEIAREVKGALPLLLDEAALRLGEDRERVRRTIIGLGHNPNMAAVLLVGLGGGYMDPVGLAQEIAGTKKPVEVATVLSSGGFAQALDKALGTTRRLVREVSRIRRKRVPVTYLTLGIKCGGSAGNSGLLSNMVVGRAVDTLLENGGSAIFSETPEVIGAEHLLAERAVNGEVKRRVLEVVRRMEATIKRAGEDIRGSQPTDGNIKGGLTTLEEKSLGALAKTGTGPLSGVLEYAERAAGRGLFFMDGPAGPISIMVGQAAAGAQIFAYTTGGGFYTSFRNLPGWGVGGLPVAPTISVVSNKSNPRDEEEERFFDIHCQGVLEDRESIDHVVKRFLRELKAVATGKLTKAEKALPRCWVPLEMYYTGPIL